MPAVSEAQQQTRRKRVPPLTPAESAGAEKWSRKMIRRRLCKLRRNDGARRDR